MASAHDHGRNGADAHSAGAATQRGPIERPLPRAPSAGATRAQKPLPRAPSAGATRTQKPLRAPPALPMRTTPNGVRPTIAESLRDLDGAAEILEQAQVGDRNAALRFLAQCMAVRRNADRHPTEQADLQKALAERGLRARSSDRSKFTLVVKYAEQRCSLSSALRSIYVAALEHAHLHGVEAAAVPDFVTGQGGLKKCVAAYRASRRGDGGAPGDDAEARAAQASEGRPSFRVAAIPKGETAPFVALLLKRDPKQDGHWTAVGHKPADERMIRVLLPKPSGR